MDQTTANTLFDHGAIFLLLDVPKNTEFGIDYNCWRTGPNFKGVKMIPPGIHYIYYNVTDKEGNLGIRNGFFHNFKQKEILAKKWDSQAEVIDPNYTFSKSEIENFELNKQELDRFLGAYPYEEYKRWVSLTNNFNETFLEKLTPESSIISSGSILVGQEFTSKNSDHDKTQFEKRFKPPESLAEAEKRLPDILTEKGSNIRFSNLPVKCIPKDAKPSEVTKHSIDMSYRLEKLIEQQKQLNIEPNELNVICELQFSFICFLIGQVLDAFEQWKSLLSLLCNCESSIKNRVKFFLELVNVLYFQLKEMPEDFFIDIISKDNFLTVNLHNLFDNINNVVEENLDQVELKNLQNKCYKFKNYLSQRFKIDFEQEPDEYAPVICD